MLTSQTTIELERPGRYLVQLCRHAAAMGTSRGGHRPRDHATGAALARGDLQVHAEHTDTHGVITITPLGRCTLDATGTTLVLRVDAADQDALRQIQTIVSRDLERFGRRDGLTVAWPESELTGDTETPAPTAPSHATAARPSRRMLILLALLIVVVVAVHLGLGAAVLAGAPWAGVTLDIILVVVIVKMLLAVVGGRALHRRHRHHKGSPDGAGRHS